MRRFREPLEAHAGELAGVAADVKQAAGGCGGKLVAHQREGLVGVEVVEGEPALARRFGHDRQAFVQGVPRAQGLEACRLALLQRFVEMRGGLVADVAREIEVDARHLVFEQEAAELAEMEAIGTAIHDVQAEARFEQHAHGVGGEAGFLDDGFDAQAVGHGVGQGGEHAAVAHHGRRLEGQRREGELLRGRDGVDRAHRVTVEGGRRGSLRLLPERIEVEPVQGMAAGITGEQCERSDRPWAAAPRRGCRPAPARRSRRTRRGSGRRPRTGRSPSARARRRAPPGRAGRPETSAGRPRKSLASAAAFSLRSARATTRPPRASTS